MTLAQNCSGFRTCSQCLEQPECGWCGDPTSTGKGLCMEGSYRGPMKRPSKQGQQGQTTDMNLEPGLCPKDKGFEWAFINCPACQCNGHSTCVNVSVCEQCRNLTTGPHCQTCMPGFHGDPTNGGKCQACKCNSHANVCQVLTGKCFCTTKGIKGDQCQLETSPRQQTTAAPASAAAAPASAAAAPASAAAAPASAAAAPASAAAAPASAAAAPASAA
uniref:Laminin EGF-like domain-containing protein n=1 Tax=Knipowitschia caucasica TaxID=637954 RepID=A0AAV2LIG3_KNICA